MIGELSGNHRLRPEVQIGRSQSRIDFVLETESGADATAAAPTWVEVKNVSLVAAGRGLFPDAPTERGRRHLVALAERAVAGERAVLVFCIQRGDAQSMAPADGIDSHYGRLLREVVAAGVEILPYRARVTLDGIALRDRLPLVLD